MAIIVHTLYCGVKLPVSLYFL